MRPEPEAPLPIDPSLKPTVYVVELPADTPLEDILAVIERDGAVILTGFASEQDLAGIKNETIDYWKGGSKHHDASGVTEIIPSGTTLINGLVGKSQSARNLCEHPTLDAIRKAILTDVFQIRMEEFNEQFIIDPLLSLSLTFNVGPGGPRQRLHRDDVIFAATHDRPFVLNKSLQIGCLVAGVETTRENGATMVVPGSHLWDDVREPRLDEMCFAEMKPGSALVFLASIYHGGGANTVPGFTRTVHGFFFVRGSLRTEENQFLTIPFKEVKGMSDNMRSLIGYKRTGVLIGLVENADPAGDLDNIFANITA